MSSASASVSRATLEQQIISQIRKEKDPAQIAQAMSPLIEEGNLSSISRIYLHIANFCPLPSIWKHRTYVSKKIARHLLEKIPASPNNEEHIPLLKELRKDLSYRGCANRANLAAQKIGRPGANIELMQSAMTLAKRSSTFLERGNIDRAEERMQQAWDTAKIIPTGLEGGGLGEKEIAYFHMIHTLCDQSESTYRHEEQLAHSLLDQAYKILKEWKKAVVFSSFCIARSEERMEETCEKIGYFPEVEELSSNLDLLNVEEKRE